MKKYIKKTVFLMLFLAFVMTSYVFADDAPRPLAVNQTVSGAPESRKFDLYELNINARGKLNLVLNHANLFDEKVYWTVELLAEDLETVLQTFDSKGTDESYTANSYGLSAGKYYVKVYARKDCSHEYSETPYQLTPSFIESQAWEIEWNSATKSGNNNQGTATGVTVNSPISGTINNADDEDYYSVSVPQNGYISLNFAHENIYKTDVYWIISLVDARTKEIVTVNSEGTRTGVNSPQIGVTKGVYYIKITPGSRDRVSGRNYTVKLNYKKSSGWETEYNASTKKHNNSMSHANSIKVGKNMQGTLSSPTDKDYYTFDLKNSKNVQFKLSHSYFAKKKEFYKVTVYNSKLKKVLTFSSKGIDKNTSKRKVLKKGKYFVLISPGKTFTSKPYKLSIK